MNMAKFQQFLLFLLVFAGGDPQDQVDTGDQQISDECANVTDCIACIDKLGCSWLPVLAECRKEEFCTYGEICWNSNMWYLSTSICESDHCYRKASCVDCLREEITTMMGDDCSWFYSNSGLVCRPAEKCHPNLNCFVLDDVTDADETTEDFCEYLEDETCAEISSCAECLQAGDACGWNLRVENPPGWCVPKSNCGTNCFTSDDIDDTVTPEKYCEDMEEEFEREVEICREAETCKECYKIELTKFDTCKWYRNYAYADSTTIYQEYCSLECTDVPYNTCDEIPSFCPCAPDSSCEDCLANGCGYWADDNPRGYTGYWGGYNPRRYIDGGRCYHICRDHEYEFDTNDKNCFQFDESLGLTPRELCADHDACESHSSCKDCYTQELPSNGNSTCFWLHDNFCVPRCDSTDPQCTNLEEDVFEPSCFCSSDTPCQECLGDGCGWDWLEDRCRLECGNSKTCFTKDDFPDEHFDDLCSHCSSDTFCEDCLGDGCNWDANDKKCRLECDDYSRKCFIADDFPGEGLDKLCSSQELGPVFKVPFRAEALEFVDYYEIDQDTDEGDCDLGAPVDAKYTTHPPAYTPTRCRSRCFVGWTQPGEWLEYAFRTPLRAAGYVDIEARFSSKRSKSVRLWLDGHYIDDLSLPGKGWDIFLDRSIQQVFVDESNSHRLRVEFTDGKVNLCEIRVHNFQEVQVLVHIEAEDYRGYSEATAGINYGGACDHGDGVDMKLRPTGGNTENCIVGWTQSGEWLDYGLSIDEGRPISIHAQLASKRKRRFVHLEIDGVDVSGKIEAPGYGWFDFEDVTLVENLFLESGPHNLRVYFDTGRVNLDSMDVVSIGAS